MRPAAGAKTWREWVAALDAISAASMPHREIAERVCEDYEGVSDWWAQMVTVGYERLRGLREVGQRRDGAFEANRSKTYHVPIARLYGAFARRAERDRWLPGVDLTVRTATENKSMRITWPDDTSVSVYFIDKGEERSQVAVQHSKLADADAVRRVKEYWGERFAALAEHLAS